MSSVVFFESLFSLSALQKAWFRVEESDGCAGIDNVSLHRFASQLDTELKRLQTDILNETYQALPLLRFYIPKKDGGKRPLNVAVVRDRIAQHAVIAYLEPILEAEFENCSYAYRRGRSVRQALDQIEFLRDSGYTWVLEADITSYFDTVDHQILLQKLSPFISDKKILQLIKLWLKARIYDGKRLWETEIGLPQGQPIAPILANLYLDSFDEEMLKSGRKLVRFADDFVILCKSKPKAEAALNLTKRLMKDLKLSLNENKTRVTNFSHGFKYLGAVFMQSICLISTVEPKEDSKVEMPERFFADDIFLQNPYTFNSSMSIELKEALANPENEIVSNVLTEKKSETMENINKPNEFLPPTLFTLCTLYIHEHGAVLRYENKRLEVIKDEIEIFSVPLNKVEQIVLFGNSQITTAVMKNCLRQEIPILLFSGQGKFLGSIAANSTENVVLHQSQFVKMQDENFVIDMAKRLVAGKITNCKAFLQRRSRDNNSEKLTKSIEQMTKTEETLTNATTLDAILGCEGSASVAYFAGLNECIAQPFEFSKRTRRPPQNPVNALLSFGYAMLFQNIYGLVKARGLSPNVGNLHALQQGHPALCSDFIEEFRSPIVDSLVVSVINKKVVTLEDFFYEEYVADEEFEESEELEEIETKRRCLLTDEARKKFIQQFEQRMNTQIQHKRANMRTSWRGCIDLQIGHYIKILRGEAEHYLPFEYR
jgi:CRISP-associated protein Cas1